MGFNISVVDGSGRAICSICKSIIIKGKLNQVVATGWRASTRVHRSCIIDWEKIKILEAL